MLALAVFPKDGMGHVDGLVRIERDVNLIQQIAAPADEVGQRLHIFVGALDIEGTAVGIAEIILRIDGDQMRFHICFAFRNGLYRQNEMIV